jgi:hypothetical protein
VLQLVSDVIDEMLALADAQGCKFGPEFKQRTIDDMTASNAESIMWQDYVARRPMEVETYLGSPIRLAQEAGISVPRIETLYAILHNLNITNRSKPKFETAGVAPPGSPTSASPMPRASIQGPPRPMPNGNGMPAPRPRPRGASNLGPPRRPPVGVNGMPPNGYPRPTNGGPNGYGSRQPSRRGSMEGPDLEEFSHVVLYDDIPEGVEGSYGDPQNMAMREKELQLRQRELAIREQEMRMRRGPPPPQRRGPPPMRNGGGGMYDDEDDDGDYFDPESVPIQPMVDPENFDMMSVTSRKNRKGPGPSPAQFRKNPEYDNHPGRGGGGRFRPSFPRNRSSQIQAPGVHDNVLDEAMMGISSNRYGNVDRGQMQQESRANSLTAARLDELQFGQGNGPMPGGGMNGAYPRRASQSPGNPYSPSIRGGNGRPSPPFGVQGAGPVGPMNGRPSPPDGVRQPVPRYPPGHGTAVAAQQVEQQVGVSALQPPKAKNIRSLTGSASASAGSGDSTSEPSANSSQSSLGPRPPIPVR